MGINALEIYLQSIGQTIEDYRAEKERNKPEYLYHGTDAKMVRMTEDERHVFFDSCNTVIEKIAPIIPQYELKKLQDLPETGNFWYRGIQDTIRCISSMKDGDMRYQYGHLYLTTNGLNAEHYARNSYAGGEFGRHAWCLINVLEYFDNNLLKSLRIGDDIDRVKLFPSSPAEPVVVSFALKDLNLNYLRYDTGALVDWTKDYPFYRYLQPLAFDLSQAEPIMGINYPVKVY